MDLQTAQKIVSVERRLDALKAPERSSDLISPFLALTGLRGFWPMSAFSSAGAAYDQSGNGRTLTYNGNPTYNYDGLVPYLDFDGTGDYLSRLDEAGLDILGTETYVAAGVRGIAYGGWFWHDASGNTEYLINKWAGAGVNSFRLIKAAGDAFVGRIYDGVNTMTATSSIAFSINTWYFVICRFLANTSFSIFVNGTSDDSADAPIASIANSNADLRIGADGAAANLMDGRASLCFLCAAYLSNAHISSLFQQTRGAFGV